MLVSSREIADRLGVKIDTVRKWRNRDLGFPSPLVELAIGPVWDWEDVKEWSDGRD